MARKHKGMENKEIREMDKKKGKKGFVEPKDRKGGEIRWNKLEEMIDELGRTWGLHSGK